jgi:hypothetical protein
MDLIRRTSRTFASLVIGAVFGCGLVHVLGMLALYTVLLIQGEPLEVHPGILAGAMWVGAMQGVKALPVAVLLGGLLHSGLKRAGQTGVLPYACAGLIVAAASALVFGLIDGFTFNSAFAVMGALAGALGGCLFWLGRRPDRDVAA